MQTWNACVCRRQSDEQRSEAFPLKPKLWQASVHPWHGRLLIYCASVLCVGWKASSFLWLAASFLSHIFFGSSVPSSPAQPPKEVFGQSARKNSFWKWTFFFWCEHRRVQRWKCLTSLPYFWGTRTKVHSGVIVEWGSGVLGQRGDVGFRRNREILVSSPPAHTWPRIMGHLIPDVPRGGWCPIALGIEPLAHKNACAFQCSRGQFSRRQRDAEKSGTVTPHIQSYRTYVKWPHSTMDCTVTNRKFAGKEQSCWLAKYYVHIHNVFTICWWHIFDFTGRWRLSRDERRRH